LGLRPSFVFVVVRTTTAICSNEPSMYVNVVLYLLGATTLKSQLAQASSCKVLFRGYSNCGQLRYYIQSFHITVPQKERKEETLHRFCPAPSATSRRQSYTAAKFAPLQPFRNVSHQPPYPAKHQSHAQHTSRHNQTTRFFLVALGTICLRVEQNKLNYLAILNKRRDERVCM